jgi:hypothetical protein
MSVDWEKRKTRKKIGKEGRMLSPSTEFRDEDLNMDRTEIITFPTPWHYELHMGIYIDGLTKVHAWRDTSWQILNAVISLQIISLGKAVVI